MRPSASLITGIRSQDREITSKIAVGKVDGLFAGFGSLRTQQRQRRTVRLRPTAGGNLKFLARKRSLVFFESRGGETTLRNSSISKPVNWAVRPGRKTYRASEITNRADADQFRASDEVIGIVGRGGPRRDLPHCNKSMSKAGPAKRGHDGLGNDRKGLFFSSSSSPL